MNALLCSLCPRRMASAGTAQTFTTIHKGYTISRSFVTAIQQLPVMNWFGRLLIALIVGLRRMTAQTDCEPLMQSLVQQAEATNEYGSWDACCARTGTDCYLTRASVPVGFEPCDSEHSARAGCNRVVQGTLCMIGGDSLISASPCGTSLVRTCASVTVLGGQTSSLGPVLAGHAMSILANGVLGSTLCCSVSLCLVLTTCAEQYSMACVSDGTNIICVPFDQANSDTYAIAIVQDGHGCVTQSSLLPSSTSMGLSTSSTANGSGKQGNTAVIGGAVGGAVGVICIAAITVFCRRRNNARSRSNRHTQQLPAATATARVTLSPNPATTQIMTTPFTSHPLDNQYVRSAPAQSPIGSTNHIIAESNAMAERIAAMEARLSSLVREQPLPQGAPEVHSTLGNDTAPPPYE
ncbi:hypothetical protein PILCRDRAFT_86633 [Piloderma croceum F 1598]|uniref:Uncharacterized protein n=1 Tax=Piloderma croceum (strain F 1598) TaxID=765440 RepID=A0A0C3G5E2_PILCF|nr:hypothetical protein PILCRDRAFT_86633 [Piloderma croceum F 1598]